MSELVLTAIKKINGASNVDFQLQFQGGAGVEGLFQVAAKLTRFENNLVEGKSNSVITKSIQTVGFGSSAELAKADAILSAVDLMGL